MDASSVAKIRQSSVEIETGHAALDSRKNMDRDVRESTHSIVYGAGIPRHRFKYG